MHHRPPVSGDASMKGTSIQYGSLSTTNVNLADVLSFGTTTPLAIQLSPASSTSAFRTSRGSSPLENDTVTSDAVDAGSAARVASLK